MSDTFPKYINNRKIAEKGVTLVKQIVEEQLDWIFRPIHLEHDFGLDGYIDIINEDNSVTGKYIGVQIKTGESYFKSSKSFGWVFNGEVKHLNYYLNSNFPILIILVDLEKKEAYWEFFDVDKTSKTASGWSMIIPKEHTFNVSIKQILRSLPGFEIDYMSQIEYQWELDKNLRQSGLTVLGVSKEEIVNCNTEGFATLLTRLTKTEEMIEQTRGKLTFVIFGYDDDPRQLYEIDEVKKWVNAVIPVFKYWGYFLNLDNKIARSAGLRVLHLCSVDLEILGPNPENDGYLTMPNKEQTLELMKQLFEWLNEFTDRYSISKDINIEQTYLIAEILLGVPVPRKKPL